MNAQIENLAKLQAVELEKTRLTQEARALPTEVAQVEAALADAQKHVKTTAEALIREEALRDGLELEAASHRQKAERYRTQLNTVTTPAQAAAIEHEVQFAESEIERLENEEFASLERTETQETALAAAREKVAELDLALKKTRERIALRQEEIAAEQAKLEKERDAFRAAVEPDLLARFDRIAASRGTGLARAENQQCTGCRMGIRLQMWLQLREGELLTCDSCGRLLYWDPAMAAAPKTPQSEVSATGDGRAIRRPRATGASAK